MIGEYEQIEDDTKHMMRKSSFRGTKLKSLYGEKSNTALKVQCHRISILCYKRKLGIFQVVSKHLSPQIDFIYLIRRVLRTLNRCIAHLS